MIPLHTWGGGHYRTHVSDWWLPWVPACEERLVGSLRAMSDWHGPMTNWLAP